MLIARSLEKNSVDLEEVVTANLIGSADMLDRALQGAHVGQHPVGGYVMSLAREVGFCESAVGENQALDSGGSDRLSTQQLTRKGLEVRQPLWLLIQLSGSKFCLDGGSGDISLELESRLGDPTWDIGLVEKSAAGTTSPQSGHLWIPAALDQLPPPNWDLGWYIHGLPNLSA